MFVQKHVFRPNHITRLARTWIGCGGGGGADVDVLFRK
jgi:hypothetical protein